MFSKQFFAYVAIACGFTSFWGGVEGAFYKDTLQDCPAVAEGILSLSPNSNGVGFSEAVISHFPKETQSFIYKNFRIPVPTGFERYIDAVDFAGKHENYFSDPIVVKGAAAVEEEEVPALVRKGVKFIIAVIPMYYSANLGFNLVHGMRCQAAQKSQISGL